VMSVASWSQLVVHAPPKSLIESDDGITWTASVVATL
jgi:hypothetical protein